MLKQRIITALVLAVVFVGCILFAGSAWVNLLFALVIGAATYELCGLTIKSSMPVSLVFSTVIAVAFWWFGPIEKNQLLHYQSLVGSLAWLGILVYLKFYRFSGEWGSNVRLAFFGLGLALLWFCGHDLVAIHHLFDQGGWILLYLLTLVWVADIGAYFSGRRFGKNKLAPSISPGKTWEGVIGGILANVIWMLVVYSLSDGWGMSLGWFIGIGLVTSMISVVGDLFESILKREAGLKDSGKLLPGHGGVLDRIDSVIAAAPVFMMGLFLSGLL